MKLIRKLFAPLVNFKSRALSKIRRASLVNISRKLLSNAELPIYLDIGARGGLPGSWAELLRTKIIKAAAIELDPMECNRLRTQFPDLTCLPFALGARVETRCLYITRASGCTSFLKPNEDVLADFEVKAYFDIVKTIDLQIVPYADLVARGEAPKPTFIKLDVQGFEREVIAGFGSALNETVAIEMEGHFRALYRDQWTAGEMISEMHKLGFSLRKIVQQGPFEGEFIEGNFYFSRLRETLSASKASALKLWEHIEKIEAAPPYEAISDSAPITATQIP